MLICVLVTFILKFIKSLEVVFGILFCTFLTKSASYNEGSESLPSFLCIFLYLYKPVPTMPQGAIQ